MSQRQIRSYEATIDDVSRKERSVTAIINTATVDRYRTVIDPLGADIRNFMSSPTVLWEHGMDPTRGRLPIGRASSVKVRKSGPDILARTFFRGDDYSQQLFEGYDDGTLRGWSIDFLPDMRSSSPPTPQEIRKRPELEQCQMMFRKWELTGYSAVAYAGNPEALSIAVERGLWVPEDIRRTLPSRAMGEGSAAAGGAVTKDEHGRYITHSGDEWIVHAEDGKVLGKHKTEADAKKQLAAVEAHKDGRTLTTTIPATGLPPLRGRTLEDVMAATERRIKATVAGEMSRAVEEARDLAWGRV